MEIKGNVIVNLRQNGDYEIYDENNTIILTTNHSGIAFILEEVLNNRGSEIDLDKGWI